jgi:hypothetical protein
LFDDKHKYLDQNPVTERLHVFDVIRLKNTNDVILFHDKMLGVVVFNLSPSILGIYNLRSSLPQKKYILAYSTFCLSTVSSMFALIMIINTFIRQNPKITSSRIHKKENL